MDRLLLLLVLPITTLSWSCGAQQRTAVLRLGHGLDTTHPVHLAMQHMASDLERRSDGALRIEIYPSEQLGSEREGVELLQIGSLDMTKVSASVMESFAPSFQVFSLPYLFRDRRHLFSVLEGPIGRRLLLESQTYRLRGLGYYDAGSRSFYTRERPIHQPADLEGLKIRTQESTTAIRMVQALGGSATPIAWGELYTALQQGVVDGAENNPPSFYLSRHYEVCRYYSLDEHTAVPDVLLIGTRAWNRLSSEQQGWLEAAAAASVEVQKEIWQQASQEALEAVAAAGVEILRPDKAPFASGVQELLQSYADQPELWELIEAIRQTGSPPSTTGGEVEP